MLRLADHFKGKLKIIAVSADEDRDEDGNLLSMSKLKYVRSILVFVEYVLLIAIFLVFLIF
jgi:hypothetical protein